MYVRYSCGPMPGYHCADCDTDLVRVKDCRAVVGEEVWRCVWCHLLPALIAWARDTLTPRT